MTQHSAIDVVYLWVDGNDPIWRQKRNAAAARPSAQRQGSPAAYGNVEGRFRDNDELRYSLRALERYFPDHGHVYVVTDGQSPAWLSPSDRLTLVDHRDLIPASSLPTFDSAHIESYVHRIPGLSERFFYFNDDVFFGAPVRPAEWFFDEGVFAAWSDEPAVGAGPAHPEDSFQANACRRSIEWLKARAAEPVAQRQRAATRMAHTLRTFAHAPRPMLRSMLFELEDLAPDLFSAVRSTVFRRWDQPAVVSDFVMRWALAHGRAQIRDYRHAYVSSGDAGAAQAMALLDTAMGELDFFCINDTTDDADAFDPRLLHVRERLQALFPVTSSFERAPLTQRDTARPDWPRARNMSTESRVSG